MGLGLPLLYGATPLFSVARKDVNAVPSVKLSPVDHVYVLFTSFTSPVLVPSTVPVVCSHIKPVLLSVTVPSPLLVNRVLVQPPVSN